MSVQPALLSLFVVAVSTFAAAPAEAQRFRFEQSLDVMPAATLDVSTVRGKIDVSVGEPGRLVVVGTVTVRVAWDAPADALILARRVADHPPVERAGDVIRLRPPSDPAESRAVTVSYEVRVPRDTRVRASSDSGAITVQDVAGSAVVATQSGAIDLTRLGAGVEVKTGSGAVNVQDVGGALTIETSSSAITARELHGALYVRTKSGDVQAFLAGTGDVDVATSSSRIRLHGLSGALRASTQSGRVLASGVPRAAWDVSTGSGAVDITFEPNAGLALEAFTRSGSVKVEDVAVNGPASKGRLSGTVEGGGPLVRLTSRSGSIRITGVREP